MGGWQVSVIPSRPVVQRTHSFDRTHVVSTAVSGCPFSSANRTYGGLEDLILSLARRSRRYDLRISITPRHGRDQRPGRCRCQRRCRRPRSNWRIALPPALDHPALRHRRCKDAPPMFRMIDRRSGLPDTLTRGPRPRRRLGPRSQPPGRWRSPPKDAPGRRERPNLR